MPATSTNVDTAAATKLPKQGALAVAACRDDDVVSICGDVDSLPEDVSDALTQLVEDGSATGETGNVASAVVGKLRLLVVGVGKAPTTPRAVQTFAGNAARAARASKADRVAVLPPADEHVEATATGYVLACFDFREHKGTATKSKPFPQTKLTVLTKDKASVDRGSKLGLATNYARTIATRPGNDINPPSLAKEAQLMAKELGLSCRILDHKEAQKLGMGGLVAVGQGSESPPKMIVLGHSYDVGTGKKKAKKPKQAPLLAVGKAITFDTGGISIKPSSGMQSMVFDKCGGMAVLGFMAACAMLDLDRPVIGILAAAENMPGGRAYRPGDILDMHNGVTVEITNTDAEGRLVLADALSWGIETYQPAACVDLATLTGAAVVALGTTRAGAWSNDDGLFAQLDEASKSTGEMLWRMPLGDDYRERAQEQRRRPGQLTGPMGRLRHGRGVPAPFRAGQRDGWRRGALVPPGHRPDG